MDEKIRIEQPRERTIGSQIRSERKVLFNILRFKYCKRNLWPCHDAKKMWHAFVGETGRLLRTRFGEHCRAVIVNSANQPVARHLNNGNHRRPSQEGKGTGPMNCTPWAC